MTQAQNVAIESSQINSSGVLQVAGGGTGVTTSTGTGALVLNSSPTFIGTTVIPTINSGTSTALTLQSNGTTAITVDTSQNVGIGTSSPNASFKATFSGLFGIRLQSADTNNSAINIGSDTTNGYAFIDATKTGTGTFLPLRFSTSDNERMRIDASGNVGIGTSSPSQKLNVVGNIIGTQSITIGTGGLYQAGSIYSDSNWGMLFGAKQASPAQADFAWQNSAGTERMRISSAGFVGIATSAPSANLTVYSQRSSANQCVRVAYNGTYYLNLSEFAIDCFGNPFVVTTGTTTTGVQLAIGATSWSTYSDAKLKNVTGTYENALSDIAQIKPVKFTWKSDPEGKPQVGVLAQSVLPVVPEAVDLAEGKASGKKIGDSYYTVRYTELIPLMIAAIQELKAEFDEYKKTHP